MFPSSSKPKIRPRTVTVKRTLSTPTDLARRPSSTGTSNGTSNGMRAQAVAPAPASRYQMTPSAKVCPQVPAQSKYERKSLSVAHQRKRKVTPSTPQFASSDESSEEEDDDRLGIGGRKRQKTSSSIEPTTGNRCLEPDLKRRIRIQVDNAEDTGAGASQGKKTVMDAKLIPGVNMSRDEWAKKYKPAFPGNGENSIVELQYPSRSRPEKFETVTPLDDSDFDPLSDINFCIEEMIQHYLPPDLAVDLSSDISGITRLLKRAAQKNSPPDFQASLDDFNKLILSKLEDGTIQRVLDDMHAVPLALTRRILAQVYQRTVSPYAHQLRHVKSKETTYGELLPPFVHTIFHQTRLNSSSVFIDLGSGVGNVVLQSALQTGAESWGIEIMERPAEFARRQASELRARAKLWNISLGPVHLLEGSFLESPEIDEVLRRADIILVNNKVFGQNLNMSLLNKFLDLKHGCKVVSLASFGAGGSSKQGVRNEQSIASLFDEERFESGTNSVSWAGESVEYYIATKAR